jgi:hypothetical protein
MRAFVILLGLVAAVGSSAPRRSGSGSGSGSGVHTERHCEGNNLITETVGNTTDEVLETEVRDCVTRSMVCLEEDRDGDGDIDPTCAPPSPEQACRRLLDECVMSISVDGVALAPEQCSTAQDIDECAWMCIFGDPCATVSACLNVSCPEPPPPPGAGCCRSCENSQACGDSCISWSYECHEGPGCACQG